MGAIFHCHPDNLFAEAAGLAGQPWTCVRTRPRWEKKFAQWLLGRQVPHFLPLVARRTVSHRKVRHSECPLFPGYVFVPGLHTKQSFAQSGCVVRVLCARSDGESRRLAGEIAAVHRMLALGEQTELVTQWTPGQRVRVLEGPFMGTIGQFVRDAGGGRLIVWVEILGVGAATTLPPDTPLEAV